MTGKGKDMQIDREFLLKYDKPGPRYTSYPPAPHFRKDYSEKECLKQIKKSNIEGNKNISLYIHIPFCPRQCRYCGCTTEHFRKSDYIKSYVQAVMKEMDMVCRHLDLSRPVTMIHWGGGSPNSIYMDNIRLIMEKIAATFKLAENVEIAMECEPSLITEAGLHDLSQAGINRLSFGVQDLNAEVLRIVNRRPSKIPLKKLIPLCRDIGFENINLDFIYGLPGQTVDSFKETITKAVELDADRLVTFSYAHVPWIKEHQKQLEKYPLPGPEEKISMLLNSLDIITGAGYEFIGMDHFARKDDPLSHALQQGNLHRNFQGYATRETTGQVYAFGASGISQFHNAYIQNRKTSESYMKAVKRGDLPLECGYTLTEEDKFRRFIITEIMCNSFLDIDLLCQKFNMERDAVLHKLENEYLVLKKFKTDNLVECTHNGNIKVTSRGRLVVRNIAMVFDPLLQKKKARYSRTV
ncbi:oxygen-independent coproporphyrinogen III oxidase [Fibrobacterota bacterium]